jgi:hypothetical protein
MASPCQKVTDWTETKVAKPWEDWEERYEQRCKKRHWYDPRSWWCWTVRQLSRIVRWIVVSVWTAIVRFVCRVVSRFLSILWNLAKFLGNLVKALVTWDKCTLQEALGNIADAFISFVMGLGSISQTIVDPIQTYRLRRYVGEEIDRRFADEPALAEAIKSNVNVANGVFGYRLTVTLHRMFVDSETRTPQSGNRPHLFHLHDTKQINLYELAGFEDGCNIALKDGGLSGEGWRRSLPRTALKTYAGGGGGLIESDPPEITREELTEYITSGGTKGPPFRILAMSTRMLKSRVEAAESAGRQLGLILSFDSRLKEVTDPKFLNFAHEAIYGLVGDPVDCATRPKAQPDYLICEFGRRPTKNWWCCDADFQATEIQGAMETALCDLCAPVAVAIFRYTDNELSGWANNPIGTTGYDHDLSPSPTSGVTFRAQIPNEGRKWVLIHELGHYFSLTHVDGFDRIMVSGAKGQGSFLTASAFWRFPFHAGPRFTLSEGQRAWDFILTNFPRECLAPADFPRLHPSVCDGTQVDVGDPIIL